MDKNKEIANMFGEEVKEKVLQLALDSEAKCYVMPSNTQSDKSSIAAPMTALFNFIQLDEIDLSTYPDFAWHGLQQALDPRCNVHAGVIAHYALEKGLTTMEKLKGHGWTEREMLKVIKLPRKLRTLRDWGTDIASVYTSMKGLLKEHGGLPS